MMKDDFDRDKMKGGTGGRAEPYPVRKPAVQRPGNKSPLADDGKGKFRPLDMPNVQRPPPPVIP